MPENIVEVYNNIQIIFDNIVNSYILKSINKLSINYTLDIILNDFKYALYSRYPYYTFNPEISFHEFNNSISMKLNGNYNNFPSISYANYLTHNFKEIQIYDTYFKFPTLECDKCQLTISSTGTLIDGNFSCEEFIIKKLLE